MLLIQIGVFLISQEPQDLGRYYTFSLCVNPTGDSQTFKGQVVLTDGRTIGLAEGLYIVRVWLEPRGRVRGAIIQEQTGNSIRFQSGDRVAEFVKGCISDQDC